MFTYAFYVGGSVLIGICVCLGLLSASGWLSARVNLILARTAVGGTCVGVVMGLAYAGYMQANESRRVTLRNDEIAAVETRITFLSFDMLCRRDGTFWTAKTGEAPEPCLQRSNIRVLKSPRGRLNYFVVGKDGVPVRKRGITDFPIPFTFPDKSGEIDADALDAAFRNLR
jgi:hypothetical protein